jgi:NADH-quinone oxidoreductase subunit C
MTEGDEREVIGVRRGLFGAKGTGDTSGYGGLVAPVTCRRLAAPVRRLLRRDRRHPRTRSLARVAYHDAVEKVVIYRDEMTLHVRRPPARRWRDAARRSALRFELCWASTACTTRRRRRELHAVYPLMSITHNRRIRLEVACPDADPHVPSLSRCIPPTTGTSARPTTSSASSSTATPR